ncbi:MAG TPA: fumarate hydratase [candidate division Zixibacteria bacterium]|nr:fumarate hydratase [candidate division Zixibacteria bacterium]
MRSIRASEVAAAAGELIRTVAEKLPADVLDCIETRLRAETDQNARFTLSQIIRNAEIAREYGLPLCQDTGCSVFFVKLGTAVKIEGGDIYTAIGEGVSRAHIDGFLRKSIVRDPLDRTTNTGDNTPPVIWLEMVEGDQIELVYAPKGGGSENMSAFAMLEPFDGPKGVENFVINSVENAGGNPCPPIVVGVGIGGTSEKCAFLAKKALLRDIGTRNENKFYADMEIRLLEKINATGIGPMGLGGDSTALDVFIEVHPCHIASLPVAVNINCHCARHGKVIL